MPLSSYRAILKYWWIILALLLAQTASLWSQENVFAAALKPETATSGPSAAAVPAAAVSAPFAFVNVPQEVPRPHRFFDNQNRILFATVAAFGAADFCVTHANLASGGKELNPVTQVFSGSTPGLAANFVLETGGVIGVSYLFHKTGHHKLERLTSVVNIGGSAAAVAYGLSHR